MFDHLTSLDRNMFHNRGFIEIDVIAGLMLRQPSIVVVFFPSKLGQSIVGINLQHSSCNKIVPCSDTIGVDWILAAFP